MLSTDVTAGIKGSQRIFSVQELKRVGRSYQPTGTEFKWSNGDFTAPRAPWQFGVQLRTNRRDLPGNEQPVEQVLGWNYTPFSISGMWDDRHAGANFAINTWRDFEDLVKRGNHVKIQFEQVAITGLITKVDFTYIRKDKIGYSFTVSPHNRYEGETVRQEINPGRRVVVDPAVAVARARDGLTALQNAQAQARSANLSRVQQLLGTGLFSEVDSMIDDMAVDITSAESTVNKEILKAQDVANSLNRGAQTMATVKTKIAALIASTNSVVSTTEMAVDTAVSTLQFESWLRGLGSQSRLFVLAAEQSRRDFALRASSKPRRLHRARQGESLYTISNLYYGTPHHWRDILAYNKLSAAILAGGELLVIPEVS